MYKLFHHPICPFSRKVRIYLAAKEIKFTLVVENFWTRRADFLALNPAATVPVLVDNNSHHIICGSNIIVEYLEEKYQKNNFLGEEIQQRAESRRIQAWFDEKFYQEVSKYILHERFFKRYIPGSSAPDSEILRAARQNLITHLTYMAYLLESRKYLNGEHISLADFAAAAHLSVLDYFGDINWQHYPMVKDWYAMVKSHKVFGEILKDRLTNINPPVWYTNIDF